ncbi:MAG: peptidylprolyl isomerase [Bacteroidota bacterium]
MVFKRITLVIIAAFLLLAANAQKNIKCLIKTNMGDITLELFAQQAPVTVNNFLYYVDKHLYDSSSFFRVCTPANEASKAVPIQVIQGGNVPDEKHAAPIVMENTTKTNLRHRDGTLSMARDGVNTATSEFFICINTQPSLDHGGTRNADGQGFAAFGRVIKGMKVVKKIHEQPEKEQRLLQPVIIYSISRI